MAASLTTVGVTFGDGTLQTTAALTKDGANLYQNVLNGVQPSLQVDTIDVTGTWTKPAVNGTLALIEVWGAGGSGARNASAGDVATGGGGGGYRSMLVPFAALPSSVAVTIGLGGASRTGSNQNGAAGGSSSFGTAITATGGAGGESDTSPPTSASNSVAGGTSSVATDTFFIANGLSVLNSQPFAETGGTGGAAWENPTSTGNANPGGSTVVAGAGGGSRALTSASSGGTSTYGGAGGAGSTTTGTAGTTPGGGGGGALTTSGAGANGRVRVTVY